MALCQIVLVIKKQINIIITPVFCAGVILLLISYY